MSALEERLHDALHEGDGRPVSPDLFARVVDSIADDRTRRRRTGRTVLAWACGLVTAAASVLILTPRRNGGLDMPWWILEMVTTLALVAIALWLGPFIKRFGRAYAADVFHDNPQTGKSYIVLTDIVYYLIFTSYILFTIRFENSSDSAFVDAGLLRIETARVAGILLIIGVLHGLNLVLMPVLGQLFSINRHLPGTTRRTSDENR